MFTKRRGFLQGMLAAGCAPFVSACVGAGRGYPVNGKVRLACVGIGNQAWHDIRMFAATDLCSFAAFCDVDMGAEQTQPALAFAPDVPRFKDFRTMFDKAAGTFDAVAVMTPDFSHFPASMAAMKAGKAVFVEKPMAHTFRETQLMMDAAAESGVVTQMGNQGHSGANFHQLRAYVAQGIIDPANVAKIVAHMNLPRRWHKWHGDVRGFPAGEPVPATLDWDAWLGTTEPRAYSKDFVGGEWRSWYVYGNGCLGDWGAHLFDTCHRFFALGLPERVVLRDVEGWNPYVFPMRDTLAFTFPATAKRGAIELEWREGIGNMPQLPKGYRRLASNGAVMKAKTPPPKTTDELVPGREIWMRDGTAWEGASHLSPLYRVGASGRPPAYPRPASNHYENFLRAVRGEEEARSPFAVAGPLSQVFMLGCIAQRLNRGFAFDPVARRVAGDAEADALLAGPPPRKGWEEFYVL